MPFWFLDETPPETQAICGYSYGVVDDSNGPPPGAEVVETQEDIEIRLIAIEARIETDLNDSSIDDDDDQDKDDGQGEQR